MIVSAFALSLVLLAPLRALDIGHEVHRGPNLIPSLPIPPYIQLFSIRREVTRHERDPLEPNRARVFKVKGFSVYLADSSNHVVTRSLTRYVPQSDAAGRIVCVADRSPAGWKPHATRVKKKVSRRVSLNYGNFLAQRPSCPDSSQIIIIIYIMSTRCVRSCGGWTTDLPFKRISAIFLYG